MNDLNLTYRDVKDNYLFSLVHAVLSKDIFLSRGMTVHLRQEAICVH